MANAPTMALSVTPAYFHTAFCVSHSLLESMAPRGLPEGSIRPTSETVHIRAVIVSGLAPTIGINAYMTGIMTAPATALLMKFVSKSVTVHTINEKR